MKDTVCSVRWSTSHRQAGNDKSDTSLNRSNITERFRPPPSFNFQQIQAKISVNDIDRGRANVYKKRL
jgi:hypothetical protein